MFITKKTQILSTIGLTYHIILFLFFFSILNNIIFAKEINEVKISEVNKNENGETQRNTIKTEFKLGFGTDYYDMLILGFDIGFKYKSIILGIKIRTASELDFFSWVDSYPKKRYDVFAFSIGGVMNYDRLYLSYSSGIGLLNATLRGNFLYSTGWLFGTNYYERLSINSLCLPLRAEMGVIFGKFGISSSLEVNISKYKPLINHSFNLCLIL